MRGAMILLPLLLLAGCRDEPDFETRYDKTAKEIEARAKAMDADIAESDASAKAAGVAAPPPAQGIEPGGKIPRVAPEPLPKTANPINPASSSGE